MKKLMFFAFTLILLGSCGNSRSSKDLLSTETPMGGDTLIEIIGEWIEVPTNSAEATHPAKKVKFNRDYTMEGTPVIKKEKKTVGKKNANDSISVTTMVYQLWDQEGDTLTMISQSAIDPELQDTVTWGIVSLTSDSLKLNNAKQGTKNYIRKK